MMSSFLWKAHLPMQFVGMMALVLVLLVSKTRAAPQQDQTVMEEGYVLQSGNSLLAHNDMCELKLQYDGNLLVRRYDFSYEEYKTTWNTGTIQNDALADSDFELVINAELGALEIWHNKDPEVRVYQTVRFADSYHQRAINPYRLVMDRDCLLSLVGETHDEYDDAVYNISAWQNIRRSMTNTDVMQPGDILQGRHHMSPCGTDGKDYWATIPMFIMLQEDCNIVQRVGTTMADGGDVVWTSGTAQDDPSVECYIYVDKDFVGLFKGRFDLGQRDALYPERTGRLWRTTYGNWEETELHDDEGFYAD